MRGIDPNERPTNPIHRLGLWLARSYLRAVFIHAKQEHAKHPCPSEHERYWMGRMSTAHIALGGHFWSRWRMWRSTHRRGYRPRFYDESDAR